MKIPVYKRNIPYQANYARAVRLARPLKESSGKQRWFDWAATGEYMKAGVKVFEEAQRLGKEALSNIQETAANFSSKNRAELLNFFQKNLLSSENKETSAVEELDQYVAANAESFEKDALLRQDYVVLRHCAGQLEQEKQKYARQERLSQGEQVFLKTASATLGAAALEEYMQSNLLSAEKEMADFGISAEEWSVYRADLRQKAVTKNIASALAAAEVEEAEKTYHHFLSELPEEKAHILRRQISHKKAEKQMQKLPKEITCQLQNEDGSFSKEKAEKFVKNLDIASQEKEVFTQVLCSEMARQARQRFSREAQIYKDLLLQESSAVLTGSYQEDLTPAHFDLLQKACLARYDVSQRGNPSVFNQLYEKTVLGDIKRQEIENSFKDEKINAKEYLQLSYKFCQKQVATQDPAEELLLEAVEDLGKSQKQGKNQKQALKYMVYTVGPDLQDQLNAAIYAKKILRLEDSKK